MSGLHDETRFDCAYKAIMQYAPVALLANGYRPSTNAPGHHQTMIQALPLTIGLEADVGLLLDALRRKRNVADYAGGMIESAAAKECIVQARDLRERVKGWLRVHRPTLVHRQ